MSTIKDLRNKEENNINLVDGVKLLVPSGKTKYISMILSLIKKSIDLEGESDRIKARMVKIYGLEESIFDGIEPLQLLMLDRAFFSLFEGETLVRIKKFCEYNEKGLIQKNDLTSYDSFVDVLTQVSIAELKEVEKELESQVYKLYDDREWLIIKPLTHFSSKKYGSGTKWCTASEHDATYFHDYTRKGILIYCINRKTNYKVACHRHLGDSFVTFWNDIDTRIDSFQTELPDHIMAIIRHELLNNLVSNESLIPDEFRKMALLKTLVGRKSPRFVNDDEILPRGGGISGMTGGLGEESVGEDGISGAPMSQEEGFARQEALHRERMAARQYTPQISLDDLADLSESKLSESDVEDEMSLYEMGLKNAETLSEVLQLNKTIS